MDVQGDLNVLRTGNFSRRANQGSTSVSGISSTQSLDEHSFWWNRMETDGNGVQDVVLPDATSLAEGWQVVVDNIGSVDSLDVKTFDSTTPVLLKTVAIGRAYAFTLRKQGTEAGTWHVNYLEESDGVVATRFAATFNAAGSWGAPSGGYYTQTIAKATHTRGPNPIIQLFKLSGSDYQKVIVDRVKSLANEDITFRAPEVPDLRFAGKIVVV